MQNRIASLIASVVICLVLPAIADAFGGRLFSQSNKPTVAYYYYPVPTPVYVPVAPVPVPTAVPVPATQYGAGTTPVPYTPAPAPGYAAPSPAPPSGSFPNTNPPPLAPPRAQVGESRYNGTTTSTPTGTTVRVQSSPLGARCSVAFWNLTDRTQVFRIEGSTYVVERHKKVMLDLPYTFVWQIEGREPQTEQVPASEKTLDLVVRR